MKMLFQQTLFLFGCITLASGMGVTKSDGKEYALAVSPYKATFVEAAKYCQSIGGRLAHVMSEHDERLIELFLTSIDSSGKEAFWLGSTDLFTENVFFWEPGHIGMTYKNWGTNQPDDAGGHEPFVAIALGDANRWNTYNNIKLMQALCEVNVP